jgi:hypothetical protein
MSFLLRSNFKATSYTTAPAAGATKTWREASHLKKNRRNNGSVTAMMNKLARQKKHDPKPVKEAIKAIPLENKTYQMKPAALALKAVVRMKNLARKAGIGKAKATDHFTRLAGGLLRRDALKNQLESLTSKRDELTEKLSSTDVKLSEIKTEKKNVRTLMRKVLHSNRLDSRFSVSYMDQLDGLRNSSQELKAGAVSIKQDLYVINAKITAATEKLGNMEIPVPVIGREHSISPAGSDQLDQGGLSDSLTEDASQGRESISPASEHEVVEEAPPLIIKSTEEAISQHNAHVPEEGSLTLQPEMAPASPKRVISVSKRTSQRLSAYLEKVNKTGLMGLAMAKKALTKDAEELSSALSFVEYMHTVRSEPGARDSLNGILHNKKKASTVLVQLQKKLQRECGTYEKDFDRSIILSESERDEATQAYAHQHGLDPVKLKGLMHEVAHATSKDREVKTVVLTEYMTRA